MMTDRAHTTIANVLEVAYWLSNCVFTFDLDHCNSQGQGRANFDRGYLINGDRYDK